MALCNGDSKVGGAGSVGGSRCRVDPSRSAPGLRLLALTPFPRLIPACAHLGGESYGEHATLPPVPPRSDESAVVCLLRRRVNVLLLAPNEPPAVRYLSDVRRKCDIRHISPLDVGAFLLRRIPQDASTPSTAWVLA